MRCYEATVTKLNVRTWLHRQGANLDGQGLIDIREYGVYEWMRIYECGFWGFGESEGESCRT